MENARISIIIPCFNEGKNIYRNIEKIHAYLKDRFLDFEIIAVDDGSLDNTWEELEKARQSFSIKTVRHAANQGKGKSVRSGIIASRPDFEVVMFMDADLAIPIESLDRFMPEIAKSNDLVIASRFVPGLRILKPVLWHRRFMEKVFRILRMVILNNYSVQDTQCGFKVFKRSAASEIFPLMTINRFAFDSEIIFLATKKKFNIKELPIDLQNPVRSSVKIFRDSFNMFSDLIRIRINDSKGRYKL
jgi:glycosyltransferase involved in cell wall biosynthesis